MSNNTNKATNENPQDDKLKFEVKSSIQVDSKTPAIEAINELVKKGSIVEVKKAGNLLKHIKV